MKAAPIEITEKNAYALIVAAVGNDAELLWPSAPRDWSSRDFSRYRKSLAEFLLTEPEPTVWGSSNASQYQIVSCRIPY